MVLDGQTQRIFNSCRLQYPQCCTDIHFGT
jgi:hypothetical protein